LEDTPEDTLEDTPWGHLEGHLGGHHRRTSSENTLEDTPGGHLLGHPGGHLGGHPMRTPWRTPWRTVVAVYCLDYYEYFRSLFNPWSSKNSYGESKKEPLEHISCEQFSSIVSTVWKNILKKSINLHFSLKE
jgi:hypothetical protein